MLELEPPIEPDAVGVKHGNQRREAEEEGEDPSDESQAKVKDPAWMFAGLLDKAEDFQGDDR